jgi:Sec-independent protein translocase protein TatA
LTAEKTQSQAYGKAIDAAEEYFARIPPAPAGARDLERAVRAVRKAANDCQAALQRRERNTSLTTGLKRLDRLGEDAQDQARLARKQQADREHLHQSYENLLARVDQVEKLLAPNPPAP